MDIITVLVLLLVPVLAEYGKIRGKIAKSVNLIAAAGILGLLALSFQLSVWTAIAGMSALYAVYLFDFVAWILLLVGAILAAVNLAK